MKTGVLALTLLLSHFTSLSVFGQSVYVVDRLTDRGEGAGLRGDLRYAITNAADGDIITFEVDGVINLTGPLPNLAGSIRLEGPGPGLLNVRGGGYAGSYRIFTVLGGATVSISGLTLISGYVGYFADGGCIHNVGTLTLTNTVISNCGVEGGYGGGIFNRGSLTVSKSTIRDNVVSDPKIYLVSGAGIFNVGELIVSDSTVSHNRSAFSGGIENGGRLTVTNTTVSENEGEGIVNRGTLAISNSTISRNVAYSRGAGILNFSSLSMVNSIVAGNMPGDIDGTLSSSAYNIFGDSRGGSGYSETDLLDVDAQLGPLQDNGGPTLTHELLPGSPAIDSGDNNGAPAFDQRGPGFPRIVNGTIDRGAFEVQLASENLLSNPGFESGSLDPWLVWGDQAVGVDSSYPQSGTYHGYVIPSGSAAGLLQQVTAPASGSYTFRAYAAENTFQPVAIGIEVDGILIDFAYVVGSDYVSYTVTAPTVSAGQVIGVFLWADVSATGWAVIDTTSLTRNP